MIIVIISMLIIFIITIINYHIVTTKFILKISSS